MREEPSQQEGRTSMRTSKSVVLGAGVGIVFGGALGAAGTGMVLGAGLGLVAGLILARTGET